MGRYDLNLTEEEFWELTLKELNALIERFRSGQDWLNYRAALISSVIANTARDPKRKPTAYVPGDFMPGGEHKSQTPKQMFATIELLNAAFGGSVQEM